MSPATQLGTHTKFATKQKATTSASYHACTKCYSVQLALSSIAIAMGHGVLMLQVMVLIRNARNLLLRRISFWLLNRKQPGHDDVCS